MLMLLDPNASFQIANEFHTAMLFVAGCRKDLAAATGQAKSAAASWLREEADRTQAAAADAYVRKQPPRPEWELRRCETPSIVTPPPTAALAQVQQRLKGVSDWCWYLKSAQI